MPPVRRFRAHTDVNRNSVVVARVTAARRRHRGRFPPPRRTHPARRVARGPPVAWACAEHTVFAPRARRPRAVFGPGTAMERPQKGSFSEGLRRAGSPERCARIFSSHNINSELSLTSESSKLRRAPRGKLFCCLELGRLATWPTYLRTQVFGHLPRRRGSQAEHVRKRDT